MPVLSSYVCTPVRVSQHHCHEFLGLHTHGVHYGVSQYPYTKFPVLHEPLCRIPPIPALSYCSVTRSVHYEGLPSFLLDLYVFYIMETVTGGAGTHCGSEYTQNSRGTGKVSRITIEIIFGLSKTIRHPGLTPTTMIPLNLKYYFG